MVSPVSNSSGPLAAVEQREQDCDVRVGPPSRAVLLSLPIKATSFDRRAKPFDRRAKPFDRRANGNIAYMYLTYICN